MDWGAWTRICFLPVSGPAFLSPLSPACRWSSSVLSRAQPPAHVCVLTSPSCKDSSLVRLGPTLRLHCILIISVKALSPQVITCRSAPRARTSTYECGKETQPTTEERKLLITFFYDHSLISLMKFLGFTTYRTFALMKDVILKAMIFKSLSKI